MRVRSSSWGGYYTPTSASWINQIERFFALFTERVLRRGVFRSGAELEKTIHAYIAATNADRIRPPHLKR